MQLHSEQRHVQDVVDSGILDILDVVDSRTFPRKRPRMPPKRVKILYF